ncbi:MAG TPA: YheU family protein [Geobacteraceae bacterium]
MTEESGRHDHDEEGVEIPLDRLDPETLRRLVEEFVTREWEEVGDAHHTLDDKIAQVIQQLRDRRARVVFDLTTNSCNIVPCR